MKKRGSARASRDTQGLFLKENKAEGQVGDSFTSFLKNLCLTDTLKATEANRKRGPGTREKVRSKRINLEGNTHAQEINVSQLPV
jgi:hypothetical protein